LIFFYLLIIYLKNSAFLFPTLVKVVFSELAHQQIEFNSLPLYCPEGKPAGQPRKESKTCMKNFVSEWVSGSETGF
jgi:hypothetical protein